MKIPRISSLSQQELEKRAEASGKADASATVKQALAEANAPADTIIRIASQSPEGILARGQEKTGSAALAYRYLFGYFAETMHSIAIQVTKMK